MEDYGRRLSQIAAAHEGWGGLEVGSAAVRLSRRRAAATGARTTSPPPSALRARLRALLHGQMMAGAGRGGPGPTPDPARDQHYPLHVGPEQHRLTSRSPRPVRSHIALHRNRPSMIITKADRRTIYENLFKGESPLLPTPSSGRESARPAKARTDTDLSS